MSEPSLVSGSGSIEDGASTESMKKHIAYAAELIGLAGIYFEADREKAQQILLNLLNNAVKFTPEGGRITVEARASDESPGMAEVRVADSGVGIPAAKLETIFEPFVQLGSRPTNPNVGLGLGLSISRDLARGMGGNLTAESGVGQGSTFTLFLPLA